LNEHFEEELKRNGWYVWYTAKRGGIIVAGRSIKQLYDLVQRQGLNDDS
jgi:hypothetical protein